MKKNVKRTTKVVVAIVAAILMFFVPIGQMVSVADITEEPTISITEEGEKLSDKYDRKYYRRG